MRLAASGIEVWRIQLHGRWGSDAVLRYIRLSPLSATLALETSLGKDLKQVQAAIAKAKGELASLKTARTSLQNPGASSSGDQSDQLEVVLQEALGAHLAKEAGVLGKPMVDELLTHTKGWHRKPYPRELLVANDMSSLVHALRPPQLHDEEVNLGELWTDMQQHGGHLTWCGCKLTTRAPTSLVIWDAEIAAISSLCKRCFGRETDQVVDSSSGSSSA